MTTDSPCANCLEQIDDHTPDELTTCEREHRLALEQMGLV